MFLSLIFLSSMESAEQQQAELNRSPSRYSTELLGRYYQRAWGGIARPAHLGIRFCRDGSEKYAMRLCKLIVIVSPWFSLSCLQQAPRWAVSAEPT